MVTKFKPDINKVYHIEQYSLIYAMEGSGSIEVDFNNHYDWQEKLIFLEKGQYIKFLSDDFLIRKIEIPSEKIFQNKNVRVLFKHLISLGYINFNECSDCQKYLSNTLFSDNISDIVDISSQQWFWQNPFQATKQEYQVIFDVKEIIDEQFSNHLTNEGMASLIVENGYNAQSLIKNKVGISIKKLLSNKRLVESKKEIAFTDKNIQEIAHDLGYKDPAYFNKVFKANTGQNPSQFRNNFDYENRDTFTQDLTELLHEYHKEQHTLDFYADKMNLSVKALSKKVKLKMNASLGKLIRNELIITSKRMLDLGATIVDISFRLRFEEPNHFSSFFKHYTGYSPTEYKNKKYNS